MPNLEFEEKRKILDQFGQLLIREAYDHSRSGVKEVISGESRKIPLLKPYCEQFDKLNKEGKELVENFMPEVISSTLFDFLRIVEENEELTLSISIKDAVYDLAELSGHLIGELPGEHGWIGKFSKYH
ncbi:hypothetical protein [Aureicoccus marinus]|uniref:Uncharacterized protein n=1 Tax=Aureicoccus marinus TaxID=754435 RepID=A0A2S7T6Q3_9FLAO|nr:hypothetical protein [Aureicoccus marinus]PQJ15207.1 hypothetical protein BST99_05215 [Aureicoccus marinus]